MSLKFIAAIFVIAAVPVCAQAQNPPNAPKPTKAAAERVVQTISADKAKTQKYCEIAALGEQIDQASQKKDEKKVDELSQKADDMSAQLGPEFVALMNGLQDLDPNSKEGKDIEAVLDGLDNLCGKK
jgi:ABC-type transporter Mla subunit MlaD